MFISRESVQLTLGHSSSPTPRLTDSGSVYMCRCRWSRRPAAFTVHPRGRTAELHPAALLAAEASRWLRFCYGLATKQQSEGHALLQLLINLIKWMQSEKQQQESGAEVYRKKGVEEATLGALKAQVTNPKPSRAASLRRQPTLTVSHLVTPTPFPLKAQQEQCLGNN